jgi:hypothetical protein
MDKTLLLLTWEATKSLIDKEMHEAGKEQDSVKYAIKSEISRTISLFISDIKKLDLHSVSSNIKNKCNHSDNDPEAYINGSSYGGEFIGLYCEKCDTVHAVSI